MGLWMNRSLVFDSSKEKTDLNWDYDAKPFGSRKWLRGIRFGLIMERYTATIIPSSKERGCRMKKDRFAALAYAVISVGVIAFQVALAAGAP